MHPGRRTHPYVQIRMGRGLIQSEAGPDARAVVRWNMRRLIGAGRANWLKRRIVQMGRPTIFLVDDDDFIRSVLADMLRPAGYAVEEFPSAEAFVAALRPGMTGCLILDMEMPGMSGVELQAELRRREIGLPIIFLSGHEDVPTTVAAIKGGAEDFLIKPADENILLERVRIALEHDEKRRAEEVAREHARSSLEKLTPRESEILGLALAGHTNKEIARILEISHRTVETHRARIFLKTGASSLVDLAQMAAVCDYRFDR